MFNSSGPYFIVCFLFCFLRGLIPNLKLLVWSVMPYKSFYLGFFFFFFSKLQIEIKRNTSALWFWWLFWNLWIKFEMYFLIFYFLLFIGFCQLHVFVLFHTCIIVCEDFIFAQWCKSRPTCNQSSTIALSYGLSKEWWRYNKWVAMQPSNDSQKITTHCGA